MTRHTPSVLRFNCVLVACAGTAIPGSLVHAQLDEPFPLIFDLGSLSGLSGGDGSLGVIIEGIDANDLLGAEVSSAGDINGDGFEDIVISSRRGYPYGSQNRDIAYVLFGRGNGASFKASFQAENLTGRNGFRIGKLNPSQYGGSYFEYSVAGLGDVNGDGIDDLGVSGMASKGGAAACVIYGRDTQTQGDFEVRVDPTQFGGGDGFRLGSVSDVYSTFFYPTRINSAGDVNGDGVDDIVVGEYQSNITKDRIIGYVVYGKDPLAGDGQFPADVNPLELGIEQGLLIQRPVDQYAFTWQIDGVGDINGDGFDDIGVGAAYGYTTGAASFVIFGATDMVPRGLGPQRVIDLGALDGDTGFGISAFNQYSYSGIYNVSGAGDLNGDGIDDLAIGGNPFTDPGSGPALSAVVVFGRDTAGSDAPFPARLEIQDPGPGLYQLRSSFIESPYGRVVVSGVGDINGDGFDDLAVTEDGATRGNDMYAYAEGKTNVIFGRAEGIPFPPATPMGYIDPIVGFSLFGFERDGRSGWSVAPAGDTNGDGVGDLLIGAPFVDQGSNLDVGAAYLVYGRTGNFATIQSTCFADLNNDGTLDFFDLTAYLDLFSQGCP